MNETIKTQLNHRSIRQFKPVALTQDEVNLLVDVARHTSTSNFRQAYSIISITDEKLKKVLTKDEYELIVEKDKKNINNLQIKFKIVEVFQKILNLEKEDKISINN